MLSRPYDPFSPHLPVWDLGHITPPPEFTLEETEILDDEITASVPDIPAAPVRKTRRRGSGTVKRDPRIPR